MSSRGKAFLFLFLFSINANADWGVRRIHTDWAHAHGINGRGQKIAVLDTGYNQLATGTVKGWNFVHNNSDFKDDHGHGTHVTGIISSIAKSSEIYALKVIDQNGSVYPKAVAEAIDFAIKNSIKIINCSWYDETDATWIAFKKAEAAGILMIVAADNEGKNIDFETVYPASFNLSNMLNVAASTTENKLSVLSSWGRKTVHVAAPGENILSDQKSMSGASQAAAHVTGAVALLWQKFYSQDFNFIKERIINTVDVSRQLEHKIVSGGVVNIKKAAMNIRNPIKEVYAKPWLKLERKIETDHPIKADQSRVFRINVPEAKYIRLHFEKIDLNETNEHILIGHEDETRNPYYYNKVSGKKENYTSEYIPGENVILRLDTSPINNDFPGWGFKINYIEIIK